MYPFTSLISRGRSHSKDPGGTPALRGGYFRDANTIAGKVCPFAKVVSMLASGNKGFVCLRIKVYCFPFGLEEISTDVWLKNNTDLLSYSSRGQKSEIISLGSDQGVGRPAFLAGSSRGVSIYLPFPAFRRFWHFLVCDLCPLQSQEWPSASFSHGITLTLTLLLPFPTFKDPVISLDLCGRSLYVNVRCWPTWIPSAALIPLYRIM